MDLQKTKILLDKINRLHQGFLDSKGNVSQIEKKLMLDYLATMYDSILMGTPATTTTARVQQAPTQPAPQPVVQVQQPVQPVAQVVPTPQHVAQKPVVQPPVQKPVVQQTPVQQVPVQQVVPTPQPTPQPVVQRVEPVRPVVKKKEEPKRVEYQPPARTPKKPTFNRAYDELFSFESAGELSERLANKPIKSIKKAMGINERYLITNELFGGDSTSFEDAVKKLDKLENFEEARIYLEKDTIAKFGWHEPEKLKRANNFLKLVRSRYNK